MNTKVCLILSGGGSNGIIQVGYLKYFYEKGIEFEVITGTSTGALQGAMYAQERFNDLLKIWYEIESHSDVYRHHFPLSFIQGVFKKSLYSASPLRSKIEKYIDLDTIIKSKQRFISCSSNLTDEMPYYVESVEENRDKIKKFVYASAAFPIAFEPVRHEGQAFWDGGLMEPVPVRHAVEKCPDADFYLIGLTNPTYVQPSKDIGSTIFGYGMRAIDTMFQEIWNSDISKGMKYWLDKKFRILSPAIAPFPSSLEWYPHLYDEKIEEGYEIAKMAWEGL